MRTNDLEPLERQLHLSVGQVIERWAESSVRDCPDRMPAFCKAVRESHPNLRDVDDSDVRAVLEEFDFGSAPKTESSSTISTADVSQAVADLPPANALV